MLSLFSDKNQKKEFFEKFSKVIDEINKLETDPKRKIKKIECEYLRKQLLLYNIRKHPLIYRFQFYNKINYNYTELVDNSTYKLCQLHLKKRNIIEDSRKWVCDLFYVSRKIRLIENNLIERRYIKPEYYNLPWWFPMFNCEVRKYYTNDFYSNSYSNYSFNKVFLGTLFVSFCVLKIIF